MLYFRILYYRIENCVAAIGAMRFCAQLRLRIFYFWGGIRMKKLIVLILVIAMIFSFSGCDEQSPVVSIKTAFVDESGNLIITLTNGETISAGNVKGEQGEKGDKGDPGEQGIPGENGTNGIDGKNGADGINGIDGKDGTDGADGKDGKDGTYSNLGSLNTPDGKQIEFRIIESGDVEYLQYRYVGEEKWNTCGNNTHNTIDGRIYPIVRKIEITKENFEEYFEYELGEIKWDELYVSQYLTVKLKDEYFKKAIDVLDPNYNDELPGTYFEIKVIYDEYDCEVDFENKTITESLVPSATNLIGTLSGGIYPYSYPYTYKGGYFEIIKRRIHHIPESSSMSSSIPESSISLPESSISLPESSISENSSEQGNESIPMPFLALDEASSSSSSSSRPSYIYETEYTLNKPTSYELVSVEGYIYLYDEIPEWRN